jgi:prepilin-type N-terminal cleavage/methylation domain-containing protein
MSDPGWNPRGDEQGEGARRLRSGLRRSWPISSQAGFSLLEVLAALVITTLLMLSLTPLVRQMLATWPGGSEVAGMVEFKVRGLGVLRSDLRRAVVWRGFGRTEDLLGFRGTETSMSFPTASNGGDGLEMVAVDVTSSADGRALIRRRAPVTGTTRTAFADPVVLFSGPYRYLMTYYSRDGSERPVWADPYAFPARVALKIVDERHRSSVISVQLPLMASMSSACLLASSLPDCPVDSEALETETAIQALMSGIPTQ